MSLQDLLEVVPTDSEEQLAPPRHRLRPPAAPRGDHHGRQRPLGEAAAQAPGRGPPRGHRRRARRGRDLGPARPRGADPLRLLGRELEAARERGQRPSWACSSATCAWSSTPSSRTTSASRSSAAWTTCPRTCATSSHRGMERTARARPACSSTSPSTTAGAPRSPTRCGAWSATWSRTDAIPAAIDEATISSYLYTAGQPDPDLLIRTSGELRVSQLPALADRLRRDLGHRRAVARLPAPAPAAGHRGLPEARAALRRHRTAFEAAPCRQQPGFAGEPRRRVLRRSSPCLARRRSSSGRPALAPALVALARSRRASSSSSASCAPAGSCRCGAPASCWPPRCSSRSPSRAGSARRSGPCWRAAAADRDPAPGAATSTRRVPAAAATLLGAVYLGALGGTIAAPAHPGAPRARGPGASCCSSRSSWSPTPSPSSSATPWAAGGSRPSISPGKTVEGALGGLVGGVLGALAVRQLGLPALPAVARGGPRRRGRGPRASWATSTRACSSAGPG